jgi:hypothetical protein
MALGATMLASIGAGVGAVAVLRLSWARAKRSRVLNTLGWGLVALAAVLGWVEAGAWGATVTALWAMGAAMLVLGWAAWRSPPARRTVSNRRAGMLPEQGEPARIGGRVATFLLVTVAAMAASIAFAIAVRWLAVLMGASEANANVLALFAVPLGWTVLAFLMLMIDSRRRQFALLAGYFAAAIPAFLMGTAL